MERRQTSFTESVCDKVLTLSLCVQSTQYKTVDRVVQTLKNLCCALDEVETQTITETVKRLRHAANLPRTHSPKVGLTHADGAVVTHVLMQTYSVNVFICRWGPDHRVSRPMVSPVTMHLHVKLFMNTRTYDLSDP